MDTNLLSDRDFSLGGYSSTSEILGEGTFGIVFSAVQDSTGKAVAVKKIHIGVDDEGIPSTALREIATLKRLRHKNLVCLIEVSYRPTELYLVFEKHPMDLKELLSKVNPEVGLESETIKRYIRDILTGMNYLHTRLFFHRDLKPGNILVADDGSLKIADFGLIRNYVAHSAPLTHEVVTLWYRPPEILIREEGPYDLTTDVWSIGCIFAELFLLRPLFEGRSDISQLLAIFEKLGTPNDEIWAEFSTLHKYSAKFPLFRPTEINKLVPSMDSDAADLLKRMLAYPKEQRIPCIAALKHPYLESVNTPDTFSRHYYSASSTPAKTPKSKALIH